MAWEVGILMLIYLLIRRYIIRKDIQSRSLYVTSHEIVYKAIYGIHTIRVENLSHGNLHQNNIIHRVVAG